MRPPFEQIVGAALDTGSTGDILQRLVEVLRAAWSADQVSLSNGGTPPIRAVPDAAPLHVDVGTLSEAPTALDGDRATLLGLTLRPPSGGDWHLVLARTGQPWSATEREQLATCRSHIALVLAHAVLRQQVADHAEHEAEAIATNERFLNVLSHELRNPLAPILMWTSTLRRLRDGDAEVQRATEAIAHAVSMERRLIEELLDVSRLQRGGVELSRQAIDLRDVARAAIDAHRAALEQHELAVVEELPAEAVRVNGDSERLRQAIGNLLTNAAKYAPRGGTVAVAVTREGARASVRVSDDGTGFPPDVRDTAFRPFVQGSNAHGGLGVGLAVTHGLVALHDGTTQVAEPGDRGGATVVVSLPALPSKP